MSLPRQLEVTLLVVAFIGGIVGTGIADRLLLEAIGPHPAVAQAIYWALVPAEGLGGLIAFWFLLPRVEFLWCGYQVGVTTHSQLRDLPGAAAAVVNEGPKGKSWLRGRAAGGTCSCWSRASWGR